MAAESIDMSGLSTIHYASGKISFSLGKLLDIADKYPEGTDGGILLFVGTDPSGNIKHTKQWSTGPNMTVGGLITVARRMLEMLEQLVEKDALTSLPGLAQSLAEADEPITITVSAPPVQTAPTAPPAAVKATVEPVASEAKPDAPKVAAMQPVTKVAPLTSEQILARRLMAGPYPMREVLRRFMGGI